MIKNAISDIIELLNKDNPHNQHLAAGFESILQSAQSMNKKSSGAARIAQHMVHMSATSLLRGVVSSSLADAYESSRLSARYQTAYGAMEQGFDPMHIVQTCVPLNA